MSHIGKTIQNKRTLLICIQKPNSNVKISKCFYTLNLVLRFYARYEKFFKNHQRPSVVICVICAIL